MRNTTLTRAEKATVRAYIMDYFAGREARDVRIHADGSVTVYVGTMPNTNQPGRIFAGWAHDLLRAAQ